MPPTPLPNDQIASSSPAVPRVATSSQNAGNVTSTAPKQNPTGRVAATSVRTPGDCSAPRKWLSSRFGVGRNEREGGSDVSASVPTTELTADTASAGAGEATVTIAAVSSGPPTNANSTIAASSAKAVVSSSGRSARRRGQSGRITAPMGGNAMPATSEASTTIPSGAC